MSYQPGPFNWQDVDHTMANAMLLDLSLKIVRELIDADERQIYFLNIGNGNSATEPSQRLEMQLLRSDEWAARTYELYCEVWCCQQRGLSPQFLRAACQHGIRSLISIRSSTAPAELNRKEQAANRSDTEWLRAMAESFSHKMELLYGKWQRAAEIDAKTVEYLFAAASERTAGEKVATDIVHARTRVRYFEARIASSESRLTACASALSVAQLRQADPHRSKLIKQMIQRLQADRTDFRGSREEWHTRLNAALSSSPEIRKQNSPAPQPSPTPRLIASAGALQVDQNETQVQRSMRRGRTSEARSKLGFASGLKRAIALLLSISPDASDLQICRGLDSDGAIELPGSWTTGANRLYELAYKDAVHKRKVEILISKVRTEMRKQGLLP